MTFALFHAAIVSPALKRVAAHWNDARATRRMPGWSDIRPAAIAGQLPIVWSYRYNAQTEEFIGRLAGQQVTSVLGARFRDASLAEIMPPAHFGWIYELLRRVVIEPALHVGSGRVFRHLDRFGKGERIVLPLATDGMTADGVLGATEYEFDTLTPDGPEPIPETLHWFAVD